MSRFISSEGWWRRKRKALSSFLYRCTSLAVTHNTAASFFSLSLSLAPLLLALQALLLVSLHAPIQKYASLKNTGKKKLKQDVLRHKFDLQVDRRINVISLRFKWVNVTSNSLLAVISVSVTCKIQRRHGGKEESLCWASLDAIWLSSGRLQFTSWASLNAPIQPEKLLLHLLSPRLKD